MMRQPLLPGLLAVVCACSPPEADLSGAGLSVLFLNVELLRADHVGLLNPASDRTPNIDRFFADSIVFEDVTAPAGETARSSAAVLSSMEGLFFSSSWRIGRGIREEKARHADKLRTIAEILEAAGFTTLGVNEGRRSGRRIGYASGFRHYHELDEEALIEGSVTFLVEALDRVRDDRFFCLYHPYTLHGPRYQYPRDRPGLTHEAVEYTESDDRLFVRADEDGLDEETRRELARALYGQQLEYVDDELGRLFEVLEEHYVEDTIIVLFANHGEGLYDNGIRDHGVSYQSCVHVPLLIRHPRVQRPIRIEEPVSLVDLVPTICEMLGVETGRDTFGISLLPLIRGGDYEREHIFGKNLQSRYVRRGDWKLIAGPEELYNVRDDPHEEHNLIADHPEIAERLKLALLAKEKEVADYRGALEGQ